MTNHQLKLAARRRDAAAAALRTAEQQLRLATAEWSRERGYCVSLRPEQALREAAR